MAVLERGLDTSNGLDFVRERLALVGKTLFLVSFGFYLFLLATQLTTSGPITLAVEKLTLRSSRAAPSAAH